MPSQQAAKKEAKARDGHECKFCGVSREQHKDEYGRDLHAHHIVKSADGGGDKPENLITVCRECHNILERTQADALSRIKDKEREEKHEYKRELESLRETHERTVEDIDTLINRLRLSLTIPFYTVHETRVTTSQLLSITTDIGDAEEAFKESEYNATLEDCSLNVRDAVVSEVFDPGEYYSTPFTSRLSEIDELSGGR